MSPFAKLVRLILVDYHDGRSCMLSRQLHPHFCLLAIAALALPSAVQAENVKKDIPYAEPVNERQTLDVYAVNGLTQLIKSGQRCAAH